MTAASSDIPSSASVRVHYRISDLMPLFIRRQFERTMIWVIHLLLIALAGMTGIYALALYLSNQTEQLRELNVWLLLPAMLLVLAVMALLYVSYANARVLLDFFKEGGEQMELRFSADGIDMRNNNGTVSTSWSEITRRETRRYGMVFWKGDMLPIVVPARDVTPETQAFMQSYAQVTAKEDPESNDYEAETDTEETDLVPNIPDYTESEYQFGDEWVTGGVRFRIEIHGEDREALMEYTLFRPSARRLLIFLALATLLLGGFMTMTYTQTAVDLRAGMLFFIILAFLFSTLFWIGVIRPLWFLRIAQRFPGKSRRRQHDAVRQIFCVLSDDVLYAKTEGQTDRVPVSTFYEIRKYKSWLLLFTTKKKAFVIPLQQLDPPVRQDLLAALSDRIAK